MSPVRHDSYLRGATRRRADQVSGVHFLLMFIAAALLVLTRVGHPIVLNLQTLVRQVVQPVLDDVAEAAAPIRTFGQSVSRALAVEDELRRLEQELATLNQLLERTSDLAQRNAELAALARLVESQPVSAVTAEVIAGPIGLFGKSVQVGAGRRDGLRYGQPVFSRDGLFGRVIAVGDTSARVLLLNDINSRIPVEVGAKRLAALLVGDNSDRPRLVYLRAGAVVAQGDEVVTSGASGEFPRGIMVGRVARGEDLRVDTAARLVAGTYLTVLRHPLPSTGRDQGQASQGGAYQGLAGEAGARFVSGARSANTEQARR